MQGCMPDQSDALLSIIYPVDLVKTRLQTTTNPSTAGRIVADIFRTTGAAGFYRGLMANLIGVTPEKAIKLAVNDSCRSAFSKRFAPDGTPLNLPPFFGMVSGAIAGMCQVVATTPMEMVKIQMQIASEKFLSLLNCRKTLLQVVRSLGIRGMYKGTLATWSRDIPFSIIFFQSSASMKKFFSSKRDGSTPFAAVFASGLIGGTIAAFLVTPMDVVKTRLQASYGDVASSSAASPSQKYKGIQDCFISIYRTEGLAAFFKGAIQRCLVIAPLFAVSLLVYEMQQSFFSRRISPAGQFEK